MTRAVQIEAPFAQIPEALLYAPDIPAEAVRVYGVLHRYGTQPGNCYPAYATIAAHIGRSERSIPGWIRILEDAGWVTRVARWRRGDVVSDDPPDDEEGWEPTSNGYFLYAVQRAGERGVRAGEQGPPRAGEQGGCAPPRAPKESHLKESHLEREQQGFALADAPASLNEFGAFWEMYPSRNGRKVGKAEALRVWNRLGQTERDDVMVCLANYSMACALGDTLAKDAHRWLRPNVWGDWRETIPILRGPSPRQRRKAEAEAAFVGDEQPTGDVGRAFFRQSGDHREVAR